jgi:hypothetical protein
MFDSLQKQADIIAKGNPDLKQDILAMSFDSYQRAESADSADEIRRV